eukprot:3162981-Rhodomonas_salina.1
MRALRVGCEAMRIQTCAYRDEAHVRARMCVVPTPYLDHIHAHTDTYSFVSILPHPPTHTHTHTQPPMPLNFPQPSNPEPQNPQNPSNPKPYQVIDGSTGEFESGFHAGGQTVLPLPATQARP